MNTRIVKKFAFAGLAALALGLAPVAGAAPAITDVTAQQRYPWNGKVDISYTADGCRDAMLAEGLELSLKVTAVDAAAQTTVVAHKPALDGDATFADGRHSVVWDMDRQGVTGIDSDAVTFSVTCEAVPGVDYETLGNRPSINGVPLAGDKTSSDLGAPTRDEIFEGLYPVGAVYVSLDAALPERFTENGREWERLEEGRFLRSTAGETGETGGANSIALTAENMPSHAHAVKGNTDGAGSHSHQQRGYWTIQKGGGGTKKQCQSKDYQGTEVLSYGGEGVGNHKHSINLTSGATGSGAAFDNRPSYLAVSMWKRTK